MVKKHIKLPEIPESHQTPAVKQLLDFLVQQQEIISGQAETIQALQDEIAILKGIKPKPKIKPSKMDEDSNSSKDKGGKSSDKRPGSEKRAKTAELEIHQTVELPAKNIPEGSEFKGYKDYVTQGIRMPSLT